MSSSHIRMQEGRGRYRTQYHKGTKPEQTLSLNDLEFSQKKSSTLSSALSQRITKLHYIGDMVPI